MSHGIGLSCFFCPSEKTDIFCFKEEKTMKKTVSIILALCLLLCLCACGGRETAPADTTPADTTPADTTPADTAPSNAPVDPAPDDTEPAESSPAEESAAAETTIYIDIAASLEAVFVDRIIPAFTTEYPNVTVQYNTGSSGKLLTGIEEANGIGHDLFFSAGKKQVTTLNETDGLVKEGSIVNLLSNQLCLVRGNDVETAVTGWDNITSAKSIALCGGSVPVGNYSRIALVALGILPEAEKPADYTTEDIAAAFGGTVEIDEADDVEVAAAKAVEGSVEVATIYYSDYYNHQNDLTIIAQDDGTLTGKIIYPVCLVENSEADEAEQQAAADLLAFLQTDVCLKAFEEYCFIVNP